MYNKSFTDVLTIDNNPENSLSMSSAHHIYSSELSTAQIQLYILFKHVVHLKYSLIMALNIIASV